MRLARSVVLMVFITLAVPLVLSCSIIGGNDDGGGSAARVVQVQLSNQVGQNGALINPGNVFPAGSRQMAASVILEGARSGMRVRGTWYQLGVAEAPPEGSEARTSETVLNADTISPEGRSRVSFSLAVGGNGFSGNSVWLLRVYINDKLASTNGFAIAAAAGQQPPAGAAPPTGGAPPPGGTAPPVAPTPRVYTVVAGDTLLIVAQRFLAPGANVNTFATEIATLNNIAPNATLTPGQVLRIP